MRGLRTLRADLSLRLHRVVPYEDEKGNRRPAKFEIDTARCLFCGLCETPARRMPLRLAKNMNSRVSPRVTW